MFSAALGDTRAWPRSGRITPQLAPLLTAAGTILACRPTPTDPPREQLSPGADAAIAVSTSAGAITATSASPPEALGAKTATPAATAKDAELPFDYPAVPTTARPGDPVLAPPARWVDNARTDGISSQSFVYFAGKMVAPGPVASVIEVAGGALEALPNALILPLRRGERAAPGDLLLTSWASGTGMQRAIVVAGGTPESPRAAYLDLDYDHPSGVAKRAEPLPPNRFHRLTEAGAVGTSVRCDERGQDRHYVLVHRTPARWLGLGYGGRLRPLDPNRCRPLPLHPKIDAGSVEIPLLGVFTPVRVRSYDAEIGRVFVRYSVGDQKLDAAVGLLNVTANGATGD